MAGRGCRREGSGTCEAGGQKRHPRRRSAPGRVAAQTQGRWSSPWRGTAGRFCWSSQRTHDISQHPETESPPAGCQPLHCSPFRLSRAAASWPGLREPSGRCPRAGSSCVPEAETEQTPLCLASLVNTSADFQLPFLQPAHSPDGQYLMKPGVSWRLPAQLPKNSPTCTLVIKYSLDSKDSSTRTLLNTHTTGHRMLLKS